MSTRPSSQFSQHGFKEGIVNETYVCPADHIGRSPITSQERIVCEDLVRQIDAKDVFEQAEAETDRAVLSAESLECFKTKDGIGFAELCLLCDGFDVSFAVHQEPAQAPGASSLD